MRAQSLLNANNPSLQLIVLLSLLRLAQCQLTVNINVYPCFTGAEYWTNPAVLFVKDCEIQPVSYVCQQTYSVAFEECVLSFVHTLSDGSPTPAWFAMTQTWDILSRTWVVTLSWTIEPTFYRSTYEGKMTHSATEPGYFSSSVSTYTLNLVTSTCATTTIIPTATDLSYPPFQLQCATANYSTASETMHFDSASSLTGNDLHCGYKTYSTNFAFLAVNNPYGGTLQQLQDELSGIGSAQTPVLFYNLAFTNDPANAGTWPVLLTVSVSSPLIVSTITEIFTLTILSPCKLTNISPSTIADITFNYGDPEQLIDLTFTDSESACYGQPNLCNLVYTVSANTIGVSVVHGAPAWIKVYPQDPSSRGTVTSITVTANAQPQQDSAAATTSFLVTVVDTCPSATLSFSTPPTDMIHVIGSLPSTQILVGSDSVSTGAASPNACSNYVYSAVESYSFVSLDSASGLLMVHSQAVEDIGKHLLKVRVGLLDFPSLANAEATITLELVSLTSASTLLASGTAETVANMLPSFKTKLAEYLVVQKTNSPASWQYLLPEIADADNDQVQLNVDFGAASSFLRLTGYESIDIQDISRYGNAKEGFYLLTFTLNDNSITLNGDISKVKNIIMLIVYPPPELPNASKSSKEDQSVNQSKAEQSESSIGYRNDTQFQEQTASRKNINQTEPQIVLVDQPIEIVVPEVVRLHMEKLLSTSQSRDKAVKKIKDAKETCSPFKSNAVVNNRTQEIELTFKPSFKFDRTDHLFQEMKRSGSIQLQLFKADPQQSPSEFDWWDIRAVSDHTLKLFVNFTDPDSISSTSIGNDRMRVLFKDASQFIHCPLQDQKEEQRQLKGMPKNTEIMVTLPCIYSSKLTRFTEVMLSILDSPAIKGGLASSQYLHYSVGMSVNLLWGGVNALQLVVTIAIYNVLMPHNSKSLIQFVQNLVTFDSIYDIWDPTEKVPFSETTAYTDTFCEVDYCSLEFFDALGSVIIFQIITVVVWISVPIIRLIGSKTGWDQWKCCKPVKERTGMFGQNTQSVVNSVVRITLENYFGYLIAGGLSLAAQSQLKQLGGANIFDKVSYWSGYFTLGFTAIFSVVVFYAILVLFPRELKIEGLQRSVRNHDSLILHLEAYLNQATKSDEEKKNEVDQVPYQQSSQKAPEHNSQRVLITSKLIEQEPPKQKKAPQLAIYSDLTSEEAEEEIKCEKAQVSNRQQPNLLQTTRPKLNLRSMNNILDMMDENHEEIEAVPDSPRSYHTNLDLPKRRLGFDSFIDDGDQQNPSEQPYLKGKYKTGLQFHPANQLQSEESNSGDLLWADSDEDEEQKMEEETFRPRFQIDDEHDGNSLDEANERKEEEKEGPEIIKVQEEAQSAQAESPSTLELPHFGQSLTERSFSKEYLQAHLESLKQKRDALLKELQKIEIKGSQNHFRQYFEDLREDLDPGYFSLFFHLVFITRRAIVVGIAFLLSDFAILQLLIFMVTSLLTASYVAAAKPFYWRYTDRMELINETLVIFIVDIYITLLSNVYDIQTLTVIGHVLNFLIVTIFLSNSIFQSYLTLPIVYNSWKTWRINSKHRRNQANQSNTRKSKPESSHEKDLPVQNRESIQLEENEENKANQSSEQLLERVRSPFSTQIGYSIRRQVADVTLARNLDYLRDSRQPFSNQNGEWEIEKLDIPLPGET